MRYRLLASYQGAPYEAGVGPTDSDVVLFAACPPPEDLKFEPATGHWRKQVHLADVQTLHESRPVGMFRGEPCVVLDDLNDRLHIVYLGHDAYRAEQIGYWEVDRGVFELITPRHEVTDIVEERLAFPHREDGTRQATAPHSASDPISSIPVPSIPVPSNPVAFNPVPSNPAESYPIVSYPATGYPARSENGARPEPPPATYPGRPQDGLSTGQQSGHDGHGSRDASVPGPGSQGRNALAPERAGRGTVAQPTFTPRQQAPGTGTFTHGPGATDYERQSAGLAPSYPPATSPAGRSDPIQGQVQSVTGFGGAPDRGLAHKGSAPVSELSVGSEPESAPDLGSAAGFLATTDVSGVAVPMIDEPPLPLEAQALRATSAAHRREQPDPAELISPPTQVQDAPTVPAESIRDATPPAATIGNLPQSAQASQSAQVPQSAQASQSAQMPQDAFPAAAAPASDSSRAELPAGPLIATPAQGSPSALAQRTLDSPSAPAHPAPNLPSASLQTQNRPPGTAGAPSQAPPPPVAEAPVPRPAQPPTTETPVPALMRPQAAMGSALDAPAAVITAAQSPVAPAAPAIDAPVSASSPVSQALPAVPEQAPQQIPADGAESQAAVMPRRRRAAKRRLPTQRIFSDLAAQAAIPASAYAVGEDVDGAMCLMRTNDGFEVFNSAGGARHEVRVFHDEESAYFYLFGVLVADAVRTGALAPRD